MDGPLVLAKRPQDANRALCRCECEPRTHPGDRPNGHILVRHESDGLEPPDVFVFSVRILFSMGVRRASQYGEERGHRVRNLAVRGSMDERWPSSIVFVNPASRLLHCPS